MAHDKDVRWIQRLANYNQALSRLKEFFTNKKLNKLEEQGLIKAFEYTYELAWNVLKDYLEHQGYDGLIGSRDVIRAAFKVGLVEDGNGWMEMLKSRGQALHVYDDQIREEMIKSLTSSYILLFRQLSSRMESIQNVSDNPG